MGTSGKTVINDPKQHEPNWFMDTNGNRITVYGTIAYTEEYDYGKDLVDGGGGIYMTSGGTGFSVDRENWDKVQGWLRG